MKLPSPVISIEIVSLTAAIVLLTRDKNSFWKIVMLYIAIALFFESYGSYLNSKKINNLWWFNMFIFLEAGFILYGLYHCLRKYINPLNIIVAGTIIVYGSYGLSVILNGYKQYNILCVNVMSVLFTVYALYYYYLLLRDEHFIVLKSHPEFWWVTGVLFYYFGSTMANIFDGMFNFKVLNWLPLRYLIYIVLNLILHSLWIYSFICRMKQRKLQS
ncbi:hypothetical protein [Pedobacter rhizosphaerae]|uniref:YhhN-like protein n=1 Tax=Pedobacter rhizosphaerae TaxID=390241 RepID=A0A1H9LLD1_9SPHI|nr:hypothetical protein [Pedobacter rhizosphaerae]SER12049.1 hypothetical protein SAMN04488023_104193 [Pedobacter rhizosphaerae]